MNDPFVDLYRMLDQLAANAWPAPVEQALESWRMRANGGVTRRANSVLTAGPVPSRQGWLGVVEDFYRSRQLPPRFHISDATPDGVAALLEANGYIAEAKSIVQIADARQVALHTTSAPGVEVVASNSVNRDWLAAYLSVEEAHLNKKVGYQAIYSAIRRPACFVRVLTEDGRTSAVGLAVTERGWTGLFSIGTRPEYRGRGLATHILNFLSGWSVTCGAPNLYLQVMEDNAIAIRLYERLGFSKLYSYQYDTKWEL